MTRVTNNSHQSSFDSVPPISNSKFFNIHISPFDGEPEYLDPFIRQVTDFAKLNNLDDNHTFVYARSLLKGPALTFFHQKEQYAKIETSQELFNVLKEQFRLPNEFKAKTDFHRLKMLPDETIRSLCHRIDLIAPRAHSKIKDPASLDSIKLDKLLAIIPNEYRTHIIQNNIDTYSEAVNKVTLLQDCNINNAILASTSSSTPFQEFKEELNALKESFQDFSNSIKQQHMPNHRDVASSHAKHQAHHSQYVTGKRQNFHKRKNFNSNRQNYYNSKQQPKHKKPFYRNSRNGNNSSSNSFSSQNALASDLHSQRPPLICGFCKNYGHESRFCKALSDFISNQAINSTVTNSSVPSNLYFPMHHPLQPHVPLQQTNSQSHMPLQNSQVHSTPYESTNYVQASGLNPHAQSFNPHPNW